MSINQKTTNAKESHMFLGIIQGGKENWIYICMKSKLSAIYRIREEMQWGLLEAIRIITRLIRAELIRVDGVGEVHEIPGHSELMRARGDQHKAKEHEGTD